MRTAKKTDKRDPHRRNLLKTIAAGISAFAFSGMALLGKSLAAETDAAPVLFASALSKRPSAAFAESSLIPTFEALFGNRKIPISDKIRVVAAELAENGAVVPVKVETDFETARSITLLASKNPVPLVAQFTFSERVKPFVATRVKLAESSEIIAVIETEDGIFQARRHVEVTIGGCSA